MPVSVTHPGVYVEEIPSGVRTISGVPTSICAFVGWADQGPVDHAELVVNFSDYQRIFGGLNRDSLMSYAVYHFFANGGQRAYIVRVAAKATTPSRSAALLPNTAEFWQAVWPADRAGGIYHLEQVDIFNLLCVPGETTGVNLGLLQSFCRERRAFLIADCAQDATFATLQYGPGRELTGGDAINSAFYFPWLKAADPLRNNQLAAFPPCGFIAGLYARTDASRGVWKAPAGVDANLDGAVALSATLNDGESAVLNAQAINSIRQFPGHGIVSWGARTLGGSGRFGSEWKYVSVRRTALYIEESLLRGTRWAVFEPNGESLWAEIRRSVSAFMNNLFIHGAFQGDTPSNSYFVKCGSSTTTQNDINQGRVNIMVGFAAVRPAEFVILHIQQSAQPAVI